MKPTRIRNHSTALAKRLRRLRLDLTAADRITRAGESNLKNWKQGRRRTPRHILRMLALYRLLHWGEF